MEFIQQNYLWFILGFIFVVMIVIGYIAEKTDFGHKKIESKDKPIDKKEEIKSLEQVKLADVVYKEQTVEPTKENIVEEVKETITNNTTETEIKPEETLTDSTLAELSVPLEDTLKEEKIVEPENTEIKEEPLEDIKEEQVEEKLEEKVENQKEQKKEPEEEATKEEKNKESNKVEEIKEEPKEKKEVTDDVWTAGTIKETMPEEVEEEKEDIWNF